MLLKPIDLKDIKQICQIEKAAHIFPWSQKLIEEFLTKKFIRWGIWDQEQLLGYSFVQPIRPEAELLNIAVLPSAQGKNIGYTLLTKIIAELKLTGFERLYLEVRVSNLRAQRLYERCGFNLIGERPNYYRTKNGREDALLYALEISLC